MSGHILDSANITMKAQVGCKYHGGRNRASAVILLKKDGWYAQNKLHNYSRSRQTLGISLHIASSHVIQKIHSKMAHFNRTLQNFSLLLHLAQCKNYWRLLLCVSLS